VLQLKYRPNRRLADVMGGWLAEICQRETWEPTLVVPVPLGKKKLRQRGYNQAGLVASALAQRLRLPMHEEALWRSRETRSQVGLDVPSRQANVQDAFRADPALVRDENVLLVDDVFTTGATLSACAQALRLGEARQVVALTVGRA
jgi:ComF family protein